MSFYLLSLYFYFASLKWLLSFYLKSDFNFSFVIHSNQHDVDYELLVIVSKLAYETIVSEFWLSLGTEYFWPCVKLS